MEKLKQLRNEKNLTCQDIADILKISKCFYWQLENSKRTLSYEMAIKIANVFNKKPDDIFYEEYKNLEKNF